MVGDVENGEDVSGFQVTGGGYGRVFRNPRFEAAGDLSYGRAGAGSVEVEGVDVLSSSVSFIEGVGLFLYNFSKPSRTTVPFVGGGLAVGRYSIDVELFGESLSIKKSYGSLVLAGGIELLRPNGRAFRLEARVGQFFALMGGLSF